MFLPLCSLPTALLPKFRPLVAGQRRPLRWFYLFDVQSVWGLAARLIPCFGCCPPPVAVWVAKRFIPGLAMGRNNAVCLLTLTPFHNQLDRAIFLEKRALPAESALSSFSVNGSGTLTYCCSSDGAPTPVLVMLGRLLRGS